MGGYQRCYLVINTVLILYKPLSTFCEESGVFNTTNFYLDTFKRISLELFSNRNYRMKTHNKNE